MRVLCKFLVRLVEVSGKRFTLFNLEGARQVDGGLAQLVEHLLCKQGVTGSSPVTSTTHFLSRKKVGKESFQRGPDGRLEEPTRANSSAG